MLGVVWDVVRWTLAAVLAAVAVAAAVIGWRWPLEAGSILFTPALLGVSAYSAIGAVMLLRARPRR